MQWFVQKDGLSKKVLPSSNTGQFVIQRKRTCITDRSTKIDCAK